MKSSDANAQPFFETNLLAVSVVGVECSCLFVLVRPVVEGGSRARRRVYLLRKQTDPGFVMEMTHRVP
jgi:hypothetical protein